MIKQDKVIIYTDGAAKGNPGKAGWGAIILYPHPTSPLVRGRSKEGVFEMGGGVKHATNNQMELTGPIEALKHLKKINTKSSMEIFSDSKYVILGITEWIFNWERNGWRNAAKKPVLNRELWEELSALTKELTCPPMRREIKWTYVKGHNEDKWNERADEIATSFAEGNPVKLKNIK
jgi:ribonuclease HI